MTAAHDIVVVVNGTAYQRSVEPRLLLSDFLRDTLGLTGAHVGCEQGVCGACTVLIDGNSARSCLALAVQADGCRIETVEGLGTIALARLPHRASASSATAGWQPASNSTLPWA